MPRHRGDAYRGAAPAGGRGEVGSAAHIALTPREELPPSKLGCSEEPWQELAISTGRKSPPNKEPGWAQARFINMNAIESSNSPQSTQDRRQRVLLPENTRSHQLGAGGEHSPGGGCSGTGADSVSVPWCSPSGHPDPAACPGSPHMRLGAVGMGAAGGEAPQMPPPGLGVSGGEDGCRLHHPGNPILHPAVIKRPALQGRRRARWITGSWALGAS